MTRPNQHTPGHVTQREKVLAFVSQHPQCTSSDIIAGIKLGDHARIGQYLIRLYHEGLVNREKSRGSRYIRWTAVEDEAADNSEHALHFEQNWQLVGGRDPLTAALFGPARKEAA